MFKNVTKIWQSPKEEKVFEFEGILVMIKKKTKLNGMEYASILVVGKDNSIPFNAFDNCYVQLGQYTKGDRVLVKYTTKNGFNKIKEISKVKSARKTKPLIEKVESSKIKEKKETPKMATAIISGQIKSTKNLRGGMKKGYCSFTVKQGKGYKVTYCYAPVDLTESSFFKKGEYVNLEVKNPDRVNNHVAYDVITLWSK